MQKNILFIIAVLILSISCSKENAAVNGLSDSAGTGGSLARFTIAANHLYIANGFNLEVFDISNPSAPELKTTVGLNGMSETIFPYGDNLFIGSTTGMFIYSLAVPDAPQLLSEAQHVRSCDPVVANDSIAFVTLKGGTACGPATDGLYIHDIKNILAPVLIKTVEIPTPAGLGLKDSLLYICQQSYGLSIYNINNPAQPVFLKSITDEYFSDVIVYDNLLICYVQTGLRLYDISEPANPRSLTLVNN